MNLFSENKIELSSVARATPHEGTIFSLLPLNEPAYQILLHKNNQWLVSAIPDPTSGLSTHGLNIGNFIGRRSTSQLATFGRDGDITVEGSDISRCHFSFEWISNTGAIMLQDRSASRSMQTSGKDVVPFEPGRIPRRVMISRNFNLEFGFSGSNRQRFRFQIVWHEATVWEPRQPSNCFVENPRWAYTVVETIPATSRTTRIHTPAPVGECKIRWREKSLLGQGSFGKVWEGWNVDSGEVFAIKVVKALPHLQQSVKREVETLSRISHSNIVEYIGGQFAALIGRQDATNSYEIFMELKEGSVEKLMESGSMTDALTGDMFIHMLQALDYLALQSIIHRDVKPANILYKRSSPNSACYTFQLADFGLANMVAEAGTIVGSLLFMAPEVNFKSHPQTSKVDIWSLLVTTMYTLDAGMFKDLAVQSNHGDIINTVRRVAALKKFNNFRDMVELDPNNRPSASQLLDRHHSGMGKAEVLVAPEDKASHVLQELTRHGNGVNLNQQARARGTRPRAIKVSTRLAVRPLRHLEEGLAQKRKLRARDSINYAV